MCIGFNFPPDFKFSEIGSTAYLNYAKFQKVTLDKVSFYNQVFFDSCEFNENTSFVEAKFNENVSFKRKI